MALSVDCSKYRYPFEVKYELRHNLHKRYSGVFIACVSHKLNVPSDVFFKLAIDYHISNITESSPHARSSLLDIFSCTIKDLYEHNAPISGNMINYMISIDLQNKDLLSRIHDIFDSEDHKKRFTQKDFHNIIYRRYSTVDKYISHVSGTSTKSAKKQRGRGRGRGRRNTRNRNLNKCRGITKSNRLCGNYIKKGNTKYCHIHSK